MRSVNDKKYKKNKIICEEIFYERKIFDIHFMNHSKLEIEKKSSK